jgi:dTDP-4-dehydrorhamnose 3,5-epimerase
MELTVEPTELDGVQILTPGVFTDHRGFFYETYSQRTFADNGIDLVFVQDNHSRSAANVVRGLHYQAPEGAQWRLVRCPVGEIYDVVVDLRVGSPTFGRWAGFHLSAENKRQLLFPPPFAHGFAVLSDVAEVQYKCTGLHNPSAERAMAWNDPDVDIRWPLVGAPVVSDKDAAGPSFKQYVERPDFPQGWDAQTQQEVDQ